MGHTHTHIAAEASTQPVVAVANNSATQAVAAATGANSLATKEQQIVAKANIANTGEVSVNTTPIQTVSDCCAPHVELGLAGVTSQEAHSYLMNLYERNACDKSYLQELYNKCDRHHRRAKDEPSYLNELYVEDCHAEHIADKCTTTAKVPVAKPTTKDICVPAQSVCTATGMGSVECKAALANCAGSTATPVETVVVTDSAKKCPAAVSVCTATGATSVECTAAKEQCVADLKAKKAAGDANIITNPLQAAMKAATTSEKHSYLQQLYQKAGHVTDPCLSAKSVCTATGLEQPACVSALVDAKAANCPLTWYQAPVVAEPVTTLPLTISPVTAQPVMTTVDPVMTTTASYL